jgi:hypothetical protein
VGYLSYSNRHADLLFELVSRRYGDDEAYSPRERPNHRIHALGDVPEAVERVS